MKTSAGPKRSKVKKHDQQSGIHTRKKKKGNSEKMESRSWYTDLKKKKKKNYSAKKTTLGKEKSEFTKYW